MTEPNPVRAKVCPECECSFLTRDTRKRYCTKRCASRKEDRARRKPLRSLTCPECGTGFETRLSQQSYCEPKCARGSKARRARARRRADRVKQGAPGGWSEEHDESWDERWEVRERLIQDGLDYGLSLEAIASDCGIKVESLLRSCARRGEMDLHDALVKRGGAPRQAAPRKREAA